MNFGIGVDIVEVSRIEALIHRGGRKFLEKHFDDAEISYCDSKANPHIHYAGRFAAKEAVYKSLKIDSKTWASWRDIVIHAGPAGLPVARLSGTVATEAESRGIEVVDISISHTELYAVGAAIACCRSGDTS